ncbi:MAG: penicillin-binding protein activator [Gammaproteobacteria bacterium]|nr:penicillin-binding protein activator [Gammaproteobacteria bacterium]
MQPKKIFSRFITLLLSGLLFSLGSSLSFSESTLVDPINQDKQTLLLKDIEKLIDDHEFTSALDKLDNIDHKNLTSKQIAKYQMLKADLFYRDKNDDNELEKSENLAPPEISEHSGAITEQVATAPIISDPIMSDTSPSTSLEKTNSDLWKKLVAQNPKNLSILADQLNNNTLDKKTKKLFAPDSNFNSNSTSNKEIMLGWIELANITKNISITNQDQFYNNIINWQERFSAHPAASFVKQQNSHQNLQTIVVLLPLKSKLAETAKAIKQGIITAHFQNSNQNKPELIFIDTGSNPQQIIDYYNKALQYNPDLIIGPLDKEAVEILSNYVAQKASGSDLNPAIIALNYVTSNNSTNFYQFGLSAEDEAEQAASKSWNDGHSKALIFVEDTQWGDRVSNIYQNKFKQFGGAITKIVKIQSNTNLKQVINTVIDTEQSQIRKSSLELVLNKKLNFQPRYRKDFDHVFIVTSAIIAKQIKPILKFYYADQVPVIATSNIYNFKLHNTANRISDLDGILFCDIPWIVQQDNSFINKNLQELQNTWRTSFDNYIRLYALGIDSYNLSYNLNKLKSIREIGIASNSGHLYLTKNNKIYRILPWAIIENGQPKMIDVL